MIPVETVPGIRGTVEGVNSSVRYLIHCKNFCKCHNVPPPRITIKKLDSIKQFLETCGKKAVVKNH
jgi:hypothetical protein